MQTWLIDIGNTKTAFALLEGDELTTRYTLSTPDLEGVLLDFVHAESHALISSVVPSATDTLQAILERRGMTSRVVTSADVPMKNEYFEIEKLGTDRILAAYAAYEEYAKEQSKNLIVVNLGTATTFECVTKEGAYLGGAITLGIGNTIDAVHAMTAQLPKVPLDVPKSAIGRTTMESLQSGIMNTQLLGIREFTQKLAVEAFQTDEPHVIATGGLAQFASSHLPELFDHVDLDLVLKGLARIATADTV
jgi:type III pantothenate kinase